MKPITDLPPEIITQIAECVHPGDVANFARANRLFFTCAEQRLEYCQRKAGELHYIHDREPLRLLQLLRSFLQEPELAFFVRRYEIWATRKDASDWTWNALGFGGRDWGTNGRDRPSEPDFDYAERVRNDNMLDTNELEIYEAFLIDDLGVKPKEACRWMKRLRKKGDDQVIKVILMALCPRLNTIVWINNRNWDGRFNPFELLDLCIRGVHAKHKDQPWPHFQSVRQVVTGVSHEGIWTRGCWYHPTWHENASLFLLPSVETLRFDMTNHHNVGGTYEWEWPDSKSNVNNLVFDANADGDTKTFHSLLSGIGRLETIEGFNWRVSKDDFVASLVEYQSDSLRGLDLSSMHVMTMSTTEGLSKLSQLKALQHIHFDVNDLIRGVPFVNDPITDAWADDRSSEPVRLRLKDVLPQTIESVRISSKVRRAISSESQSFLGMLKEFVRAKHDGAFSELRHLCLASLHSEQPTARPQEMVRLWNANGISAELMLLQSVCAQTGVECHTWSASGRQSDTCQLCERKPNDFDIAPVLGYEDSSMHGPGFSWTASDGRCSCRARRDYTRICDVCRRRR